MIKAFFIALQLMTRIPVPKYYYITQQDEPKLFGWSVLFYPLVGLLIGGLLLLLSFLLSFLSLPANGLLVSAFILTLWVLVTGALHLDGLADSADAWLGGYGDQQRTLEIMKDPCSGPAAVVVLLLVLLLKFSAIITVKWEVLLLAPVIGRTAAMLLLATTPYVRLGGMGESAANNVSKTAAWFVLLLVVLLSVFLLKELSAGLFILFVLGYLFRSMILKRIKGTTGDTAGALVEIMEAATLIVFVLLAAI
jgi:adenosylcobinamide-GDP ribazoletransferase